MRILMEEVKAPKSGKGFFLRRLATEFRLMGQDVVHDPDAHHDISLHAIRMWCKSKKPRILRLDGVYHDTRIDYKGKNACIAESVAVADGVICQSQFGLRMARTYVGLNAEKAAVIFNGVGTRWNPDGGPPVKEPYFVAASRWRPHKRLADIVESFVLSEAATDHLLLVYGDTKPVGKYKNVLYMGVADEEHLRTAFYYAKASIHLCWFDCCPNSVVEALGVSCPVITNNVGGTRELVEATGGGMVLPLDREYDFEPVDLYHPPEINRLLVAEAITVGCNPVRPMRLEPINIADVAVQYLKFFRRFM